MNICEARDIRDAGWPENQMMQRKFDALSWAIYQIEEYEAWLSKLSEYMDGSETWDTGSDVWVCEAHPLLPGGEIEHPLSCQCGAPTMQPVLLATFCKKCGERHEALRATATADGYIS